jgi:hypothetical protein
MYVWVRSPHSESSAQPENLDLREEKSRNYVSCSLIVHSRWDLLTYP